MTMGQITKIISVSEGPRPQMGPTNTTPIDLEVRTDGGLGFLQISRDAAAEFVEELSRILREIRFR